jgi:predicted amino acid-binding ACT domain protein
MKRSTSRGTAAGRGAGAKTDRPAAAYVVSVLVPDRVGILRRITGALTDLGANLTGISQTVVQGYFTVIVIAEFRRNPGADAIREAMAREFPGGEASVTVRDHAPEPRRTVSGARYILTMSGRDRPGILKAVTGFLAAKGVNIEDLFFRITGRDVVHIGEVTVPHALDLRQFQDELRALLEPLGLRGLLQHENIFRATNEVGAVQSLLAEEGGHAPDR